MRSLFSKSLLVVLTLMLMLTFVNTTDAIAEPGKNFRALWSIYAGWQPWDYAKFSGILDKWAAKYNCKVELIRMDYMPSIEAIVAKQADACVMTTQDALDMPAASGIGMTAIIVGDFSGTRNFLKFEIF